MIAFNTATFVPIPPVIFSPGTGASLVAHCNEGAINALVPLGLEGGTLHNVNSPAFCDLWQESVRDTRGALVLSETRALTAKRIAARSFEGASKLDVGVATLMGIGNCAAAYFGLVSIVGVLMITGIGGGLIIGRVIPRMVFRIHKRQIMKALNDPTRKRAFLEKVRGKAEQGDLDAFGILHVAEEGGYISRHDDTADLCLSSLPAEVLINILKEQARELNDLFDLLKPSDDPGNFEQLQPSLKASLTRSEYRKLRIDARIKELKISGGLFYFCKIRAAYDPDFRDQLREVRRETNIHLIGLDEPDSIYR